MAIYDNVDLQITDDAATHQTSLWLNKKMYLLIKQKYGSLKSFVEQMYNEKYNIKKYEIVINEDLHNNIIMKHGTVEKFIEAKWNEE